MNTLLASAILVLSLAALAQFGLFYWRSLVIQIASRELSPRMQDVAVAGVQVAQPGAEDFRVVAALYQMCPKLEENGNGMGSVRLYYRAMQALATVSAKVAPGMAGWAREEMATCSRYAAVRLDQRMERIAAHRVAVASY